MIKKIIIGILAFSFVCGGAYVYVVLKMSKGGDSQKYEVVDMKLPIEPYLVKRSNKRENALQVVEEITQNKEDKSEIEKTESKATSQTKESPHSLEQQVKALQEQKKQYAKEIQELRQAQKPQFTMQEVFTDSESEEKKELDSILQSRVNAPLSISKGKEKKSNLVTDYGVDSIKGEEGFKATNENKLFRTLISMDKIAVIITQKLNSTLGGSLVGQVRDNVYSYMGRVVLIPKGSKIQGIYKSNNKIGEDRLQIIWERIVTPNGVNIRLTGQTLDIEGASGAKGELDNRYWERYGMPLTITTATNMGMLAISNFTQKIPSVQSQDILNQGASDVSSIGKAILQEQVKINPIITIEAGDIVFVSPTKDIYFPKPKAGEIMVEYFDRLEDKKQEKEEEEQWEKSFCHYFLFLDY